MMRPPAEAPSDFQEYTLVRGCCCYCCSCGVFVSGAGGRIDMRQGVRAAFRAASMSCLPPLGSSPHEAHPSSLFAPHPSLPHRWQLRRWPPTCRSTRWESGLGCRRLRGATARMLMRWSRWGLALAWHGCAFWQRNVLEKGTKALTSLPRSPPPIHPHHAGFRVHNAEPGQLPQHAHAHAAAGGGGRAGRRGGGRCGTRPRGGRCAPTAAHIEASQPCHVHAMHAPGVLPCAFPHLPTNRAARPCSPPTSPPTLQRCTLRRRATLWRP